MVTVNFGFHLDNDRKSTSPPPLTQERKKNMEKRGPMGPLQLAVTWYKIRHAGEQATHWDVQNKENANLP